VDTVPGLRLLAFLSDGKLALRDDHMLQLWDPSITNFVDKHDVLESSSELWRRMLGRAFSPDGKTLAVSTGGGDVALLDTKTLKVRRHRPKALPYLGPSVVFSPDGDYVLTPDYGHQLKVWDVRDGKLELIDTLPNHAAAVSRVVFMPRGLLAVGCRNGTVTLWDIATWTDRVTIKCHERVLQALCFSPDGSKMVTSDTEGNVRIRRAATPQQVIEAQKRVLIHSAENSGRTRRTSDPSEQRRPVGSTTT
jgi:WD40 repeat protein